MRAKTRYSPVLSLPTTSLCQVGARTAPAKTRIDSVDATDSQIRPASWRSTDQLATVRFHPLAIRPINAPSVARRDGSGRGRQRLIIVELVRNRLRLETTPGSGRRRVTALGLAADATPRRRLLGWRQRPALE